MGTEYITLCAAILDAGEHTTQPELDALVSAWRTIRTHPDWAAYPQELHVESLDAIARLHVLRFRRSGDRADLAEAQRLTNAAAQLHPESYAVRASLVKIIEAMQAPGASQGLADELLRVMRRLRERAPLFRPDQRMSGNGTGT